MAAALRLGATVVLPLLLILLFGSASSLLDTSEDGDSRMEWRRLSAEDRALLARVWRRVEQRLNRRNHSDWAAPHRLHRIVKQMDKRLAREGAVFRLPYWDAQVDERLENPADSAIFHAPDFLPGAWEADDALWALGHGESRRVARRLRSVDGPPTVGDNRLLFVLLKLGETTTANESCAECIHSEWSFCDLASNRCVGRVALHGECARFAHVDDVCHRGSCILGRCVLDPTDKDEWMAVRHRLDVASIDSNSNSNINQSMGTDSLQLLRYEANGDGQELLPTAIPTSSPHPSTQLVDAELDDDVALQEVLPALLGPLPWLIPLNTTASTTTTSTSTSTVSIPTTLEELPTIMTATTTTTMRTHNRRRLHKKRRHRQKQISNAVESSPPSSAAPSSPSLPTVYLTATVVEGEWRRRARVQKAPARVQVFTKGANLPSGYTHQLEGEQADDGTTLLLRTIDPQTAGGLVEFSITVTDGRGRPCEQHCTRAWRRAHQKSSDGSTGSGPYMPCDRNIVRLSSYVDYSDPIQWYRSAETALLARWTGVGYFRRLVPSHLLFVCPTKDRLHRPRRQRLHDSNNTKKSEGEEDQQQVHLIQQFPDN